MLCCDCYHPAPLPRGRNGPWSTCLFPEISIYLELENRKMGGNTVQVGGEVWGLQVQGERWGREPTTTSAGGRFHLLNTALYGWLQVKHKLRSEVGRCVHHIYVWWIVRRSSLFESNKFLIEELVYLTEICLDRGQRNQAETGLILWYR